MSSFEINVDELARGLEADAKTLGPLAGLVVKRTGMELHKRLVERWPVDSGFSRNILTLTTSDPGTAERPKPEGNATYPAPNTPDVAVEDYGTAWVANMALYAERLNSGWSDQAPEFFVEAAIAEVVGQPLDKLTEGR